MKPSESSIYLEVLAIASILLALGTATYQRNLVWKSEPSLWLDVVKKVPWNDRARVNLGNEHLKNHLLNEAIAEFNKAIEINPRRYSACYNLALAYEKKGRLKEAIDFYQKVLTIKPDLVEAIVNLGTIYLQQNQTDNAITQYGKALSIKPDLPEAHWNLGLAYEKKGWIQKAVTEFEYYLWLRPGDAPMTIAKINNLHDLYKDP